MRNENPTDANITAYDSLGRVTSVTAPDGSVTSSTWLGATMTSTDPAGVSKILNYDAFNRLLQVTENPGGSPFSTNYLYDALDDLTGVCQGNSFDSNGYCQSGGIGRRFIYDSLKRLTSATNPESGNIAYSYDDNGNVLTKTDARGWITCYGTYSGSTCSNGYDPLNRLTAKTYFNAAAPTNTTPAPAITWLWDTVSKGHLSSVSAASTSPSYFSSSQFQSYDPLGRVTQSTQTTNGNNYTFYYAYNLAGALESETYPSARAAKTCYDSAGRALSVAGTPSSGQTTTYASNVTYAPHGAIQQISRGDNLTEIRSYNNRLQETAISLDTSGNARSAFGQDMYYCSNGAAACTTNNGNLLSLNLPYLSAQQSFSYDAINRLTAATETSPGTGWSQSYGYDAFGNRWVSGGITTSPFTPIAPSNFDTNNRLQIQGTQYDASGNLSAIGGYVYQNDSEGRIANVTINGSSAVYGYDGDGRRVFKQTPANTTNYVYDVSGRLTAEYSTAAATNPCQTCYLTVDHLGSTRAMTNPAGTVVSQHDYFPFGEEVPLAYGGRTALPAFQAASTDDVNQKFTGKERDAESGLDYFGARYYGSALGRFTSPDPKTFSSKFLVNPQKWNKYAYVLNNPLSNIDPDGQEEISIQYRAFIPQSNVGFIGKGDGRTFSSQANASSRVAITMRIETDPAKNNGNPLLGKPDVNINTTHNNLTGNDTKAVVIQAPTVTATQDANGNVTLNLQMNVRSGDIPDDKAGIRSNVNIGVNEAGTQGTVQGTVSGSPAFETNFTPQGGPTTNLPIQGASSNAITFTYNLTQTNKVDKKTDIKQPAQQ